jgi:tetratricopeptide (TPR) repeat protein
VLRSAIAAICLTIAGAATAQPAPGADAGPVAAAQAAPSAACARAEQLLRGRQFKEAADAAAKVLAEASAVHDRPADMARAAYLHGYATFALKDYGAAVRSLAMLAPFDGQGEMGLHARYLLARVHHLAGERPEAVADYSAVVADWERRGRDARARLAEGNVPAAQRGALEVLAKAPAPDYVARAAFYWGVVLSEFGRADEAMARYGDSIRLAPGSAVAPEARLRAAEAGVTVRKYNDVITVVSPLVDDDRHADQALRWLAKAQYGVGMTPVVKGRGVAAEMNAQPDPQLVAQGIRKAIETLRKADEGARLLAATDTRAARRRAEILIELGDMLQLDRQYDQAARVYRDAAAAAAGDAAIGERSLERQAAALQLAGQYGDADRVAATFLERFEKSELRAEVMLRFAENALLSASAKGDPAAANADGSKRPFGEAVTRFSRVIEKYPDTAQAILARVGLATVHYLQGQFSEALGILVKIPESERGADELAGAALLQADCELRALPETAEDALTSARVAQQLEETTARLETFIATRPGDESVAAEAWLRIGYASQRLAGMIVDPTEKRRTLAKARRAYQTIVQQYPNHPLYPAALLENAKILLRFNGNSPAMMELSKFQADPLDKTAVAPLALLHLADVQRARRQAADAMRLLGDLRTKYEEQWLKDPARAEWAVALQYSLGLAYKEAGKYAEAREVFTKLAADFPKRSEAAEAAWRIAQCETDPAYADVESARKALAAAGRPATQEELLAKLVEATNRLRRAGEQMGKAAEALAAGGDESDLPQRMNYDAAWCWKSVGEVEVEVARRAVQAEAMKKASAAAAAAVPAPAPERPERGKRAAAAAAAAAIKPPDVPLASIALQPGEKLAREKFRAVIDSGGESPLADDARTELIEVCAARGEAEQAITLVKEALARPQLTPDLTERLKLRQASLELDKGDAKAAAQTAAPDPVAGAVQGERRESSYAAYRRGIALEAAYRLKDYAAVIDLGRTFADQPRGIGRQSGLADVALLKMADAQGRLGKWREARDTLDLFYARFGGVGGPIAWEARFIQGWVNEHLNERARAIEAYTMVARVNAAGDLATRAKAQVDRLRQANPAPTTTTAEEPPPSSISPRLPTLLVAQRRYAAPGSPAQPAAPVVTPAVNNPEGGGRFSMLPPLRRGIQVEIAPASAPTIAPENAYVQSPAAPDDADQPATP